MPGFIFNAHFFFVTVSENVLSALHIAAVLILNGPLSLFFLVVEGSFYLRLGSLQSPSPVKLSPSYKLPLKNQMSIGSSQHSPGRCQLGHFACCVNSYWYFNYKNCNYLVYYVRKLWKRDGVGERALRVTSQYVYQFHKVRIYELGDISKTLLAEVHARGMKRRSTRLHFSLSLNLPPPPPIIQPLAFITPLLRCHNTSICINSLLSISCLCLLPLVPT